MDVMSGGAMPQTRRRLQRSLDRAKTVGPGLLGFSFVRRGETALIATRCVPARRQTGTG
jgi:hypothetical protein